MTKNSSVIKIYKGIHGRINERSVKNVSIKTKGNIQKWTGTHFEINLFVSPSPASDYRKEQKLTEIEVRQIGVIGTGLLGCQIAQFIVQHGFNVILKSRSEESLKKAIERIKCSLLKDMSLKETDKIIRKINGTTKFSDLFNADMVIECVIEDKKAKEGVFKELSNTCSHNTILATNTSSLSINALASVVSNPSRVIGTHFFNPVKITHLVEIIRARNTSQETVQVVTKFMRKLDKTTIIMEDTPGFIVNRLLFSMINEAGYLLEKVGVSVQEIDTAMKLGTNVPMGPFEIADFVGIDVTYKILKELNLSLNFKEPAKIFEEKIKSGKLGRKTKEGFYKY